VRLVGSRAAPCAPIRARSKSSRTRSPGIGRSARVRDARLRTNIGNVSTLDDAVAAFNPLCACPIPNASRLASQARSQSRKTGKIASRDVARSRINWITSMPGFGCSWWRVPMLPRTFRCLSHLERHGELVSKQDLMARVWPNVFVEPANLTVHMSALRRRCVTVGMGIASRRRCRRGPLAKPLLVSGDLKIIDGNRPGPRM